MRAALRDWEQAICLLNPEVALRISSKVVQAIMARAYVYGFAIKYSSLANL
jgi:hypothetical protein